MTQDAPGPARRRRRRGSSPAGPPAASPPAATVSAPAPAAPPAELPYSQPPRSEPPRPHAPHPEAPHPAPVRGGSAATTPTRDPDAHHLDEHHAEPGTSRGRRASDPGGTRDPAERGMRDLVGAGHSQVGVDGALRARDVNRPSAADLAEAERTVTIVRRHWKPPS